MAAATAVSLQTYSNGTLSVKSASRALLLLVDPDPCMLDYLSATLTQNYSVRACRTSAQAVAALKEGLTPDIAFVDSILPDGTGLKLLSELRAMRPTMPVVMISCTSEPRFVVQAVRAGARDFLQKPLCPSDLEDAVESLIARKPTVAA